MVAILGIMTGSSKDGMDLSLMHFPRQEKSKPAIVFHKMIRYSASIKQHLQVDQESTALSVFETEYVFTKWIAEQINPLLAEYNIDLLSLHGHTLIHRPEKGISIQLGSGAGLAALTNTTVIADFRVQDLYLGGQGTPLAPLIDSLRFPEYHCCLNIGGIANIHFQDANKRIAYDVGPANQVNDFFARLEGHSFDPDGDLAKEGEFQQELVSLWQSMDYFEMAPPKSLDNNWIQKAFIPRTQKLSFTPKDVLHSFNRFLVEQIGMECEKYGSASMKVLATGGGIRNLFFRQLLNDRLDTLGMSLEIPSEDIIDYKESMLMCYLAYNRLLERKNVLHAVTGASKDSLGGAIYGPNPRQL